MKPKALLVKYLILDYLTAAFAWALFFIIRKITIDEVDSLNDSTLILSDKNFYYGVFAIPFFWIGLYLISGFYKNIYRKSRLKEFFQLFQISALGALIIFFALLIDDDVSDYSKYYKSFLYLFSCHFLITTPIRLKLTSNVAKKIQNRSIGFNTLIVGNGSRAQKIYQELTTAKKSEGNFFKACIITSGDQGIEGLAQIKGLDAIHSAIELHDIKEVIIAIEEQEQHQIPKILYEVNGSNVAIKIIPDLYQHLTGMVKMGNVLGVILIEIQMDILPPWQKFIKRAFDVLFSALVLIIGFPVFLILGILVKSDSAGPVFFRQERIGLKGKPFMIIKFRSMRVNAESNGPQLSSENDPRITRLGKILRKTRLDEIPQFWNVLIGEMSMVGPRPERQFYIDQIVKEAPYYKRLQRIKPGITSWGQVKYGYAENVSQMIDRLQYDLLYLENISFLLDLKILVYTALIMVQGRGK